MTAAATTKKIAVVTGGSTGIGLEIVVRLLDAGYRVAFFGSSAPNVTAATDQLRSSFAQDMFVGNTIDIRDRHALAEFFDHVVSTWGTISHLINNAGISPKQGGVRIPLHRIPIDEWNAVLGVNLTGAFCCTQLVLPGMLTSEYGRIVMIGSIAARSLPRLAGASYASSKAGLVGLARSVAGEYASKDITANVVAPGNIATGMLATADEAKVKEAIDRIPAGRLGQPSDITDIVEFLCRPEASFINGAVIDVNGAEYCAP